MIVRERGQCEDIKLEEESAMTLVLSKSILLIILPNLPGGNIEILGSVILTRLTNKMSCLRKAAT